MDVSIEAVITKYNKRIAELQHIVIMQEVQLETLKEELDKLLSSDKEELGDVNGE